MKEKQIRSPWRLRAFAVLLVALGAAIASQWRPAVESPQAVHLPPLTKVLPSKILGWTFTDLPLGATEVNDVAVRRLLRYDDALFREYSAAGLRIGVLVVYWKPEDGSPSPERAHSPDVCFPNAGWTCVQKSVREGLQAGDVVCAPAEYREFSANGEKTCMLFWHLRAGKVEFGAPKQMPRWRARWIFHWQKLIEGFTGPKLTDEVFIRVTSNGTLDDILRAASFQQAAAALAGTGAFRKERQ